VKNVGESAGFSVKLLNRGLLYMAASGRGGKYPIAIARGGSGMTQRALSVLPWGLLIMSVLFAGANGLVAVDRQLHARIVLPAAIAPFIASLVSGWPANARAASGRRCLVTT